MPMAALVPLDETVLLRLAGLLRLKRRLDGHPAGPLPRAWQITARLRQRLSRHDPGAGRSPGGGELSRDRAGALWPGSRRALSLEDLIRPGPDDPIGRGRRGHDGRGLSKAAARKPLARASPRSPRRRGVADRASTSSSSCAVVLRHRDRRSRRRRRRLSPEPRSLSHARSRRRPAAALSAHA